ncbi:protein kinase domain-containing protein [Roseateles sp. NT4]|uniref:serine/threonine-protein kinase n=1 Tax=Roseateles sp. NT4 TaxID=3453715 RepID=UPI003EECBE09
MTFLAAPEEDLRRWQTLKSLLAEVMTVPPKERTAYVDHCLGGDPTMQLELRALLDSAARTTAFGSSALVKDFLNGLANRVEAWIGRRAGAYRVTRLIAHGGMGEVYEGVRDDGQYEQRVAIKVVREGPNRQALIDRFDSERRILATLDHVNLARLIDAGVSDGGDPFFVMELVEGVPIDLHCNSNKISLHGRLALIRTVCQVVHYAHSQGVIHSDIKPQNILVTPAGVVKLVDFGIAQRLHGHGNEEPATVDRRALTPEYASPEQLRGEPIGPTSDIYSLGVVLYRLLTGVSPYARALESNFSLTQAIGEVEPPRPSAAMRAPDHPGSSKDLRGDLDAIVLMALRKAPDRRYESAEALADDLFRHMGGVPVIARGGAVGYKISRWVLRHRGVVAAIGVANVLLFAGVLATTWLAIEAGQQRDRATQNATDLRKLANTLMFDVSEGLASEPGTTQARRVIVQHALAYLEKLRKQAQDDPAMLLDIVRAYRRVGDIQGGDGNPDTPNTGDPSAALCEYVQGIKLASPLVDLKSTRVEALKELAMLHKRKAVILISMGKFPEALTAAAASVDAAVKLQSESTDGTETLILLAKAHAAKAHAWAAASKNDSFQSESQLAESLARQALTAAPNDTGANSALVWTLGSRAWFYMAGFDDRQHAELALAHYRDARGIAERMAPAEPAQSRFIKLRLANNMAVGEGQALQRLGRTPEAIVKYRQGLLYWETRTYRDSTSVDSRIGLFSALSHLGSALTDSHQTDLAVDHLQRARSIYLGLPQVARAGVMNRMEYAGLLYELGRAHEQRSQHGDRAQRVAELKLAEETLGECLKIRNEAALLSIGSNPGILQPAAIQGALDAARRQLQT